MGRCVCVRCAQPFVSVNAFDRHRIGPHGKEFAPGRWRVHPGRRCLHVAEMEIGLWQRTVLGWRHPKGMREAMYAASRRGRRAA